MPEFSIIVLNWNGRRFLKTCLSALRRQTFRDFEVIFVDNASQDGSVEYVRMNFPEVFVVSLQSNLGFTGGNLAGYEHAAGEWIILLNNDTEADENWLAALHEAGEKHVGAGILACKMLYFDERKKIDNCGFDMTRAGTTVERGRDHSDGSRWNLECDVFGACAGAAAYRRSMLTDTGFLDSDFFMTYEDVDLSFRAQLRGHRCIFVPSAVVYHHYRATMKAYPSRQVYFSQRNIEFVYLKNMPLALMLRYLPQKVLYELGAALYFTRQGTGSAFVKAKLDVLRNLPSVLRKRREIQTRRILSNARILELFAQEHFRPKWTKFRQAWRKVQPGIAQSSSS
jgi:GT2 family glycosyltransferase